MINKKLKQLAKKRESATAITGSGSRSGSDPDLSKYITSKSGSRIPTSNPAKISIPTNHKLQYDSCQYDHNFKAYVFVLVLCSYVC